MTTGGARSVSTQRGTSPSRVATAPTERAHLSGPSQSSMTESSDELDVHRARALGVVLLLIGDALVVLKRAEALGHDRGVVDEEVLAALVRRDEAEALLVTEELDGSLRH